MGIKKRSDADSVMADLSVTDPIPYIIANPNGQIKLLHEDSEGFIALFRKTTEGTAQYHYKRADIEDNLKEWMQPDSYISMNTFYTPKRLVTNLKEIRTAFVDIDCQNIGWSAEMTALKLKRQYFGKTIPTPNMMIYSGRGLNLVWFLEPMSGLAVERWGKLQDAIYKTVESLGADSKAKDAARVFRLAGTKNSKSNNQVYCEVLQEEKISFDSFVTDYFPNTLRSVSKPVKPYEKKKGTKGKVKRFFNEYTLTKARMSDIQTLTQLRKGNMEGSREYALFLYRYWALVERDSKEYAADKMLEINALFSKPLRKREALADTKSAERYYDSDIPFRITHEKIIEWLGITPDEQTHLATIISDIEKQKRNTIYQREKRREQGIKERVQYDEIRRSKKEIRLERLRLLVDQSPLASKRELANLLGVSPMTVSRDMKELGL